MLNGKILSKLCALGVTAFILSSSSVFAYDFNKTKTATKTDEINVYEQDDEKAAYNQNGFTRGDLIYLYNGKYDTSQVENVTGRVEQVFRVQYPDHDTYVIALIGTRANKGKIAVNLGPVWFMEENGLAINEDDSIQLTGAKMRTNGRYVLIASEVNNDGKSLHLRDKDGSALWGSPKCQQGDSECMKKNKNK